MEKEIENNKKSRKSSKKFVNLFSIYMKTNRKRTLTIFFLCMFIVLLLSSLMLTWFSYGNNYFKNYYRDIDWYNDENQSSYSKFEKEFTSDFQIDYFDAAVDDIARKFEEVYPSAVNQSFASLEVIMRGLDSSYLQLTDFTLKTFNRKCETIFSQSLAEGRLPANENELLYFSDNIDLYTVNDTVSLRPNINDAVMKNFTISGIIRNIDDILLQNDLSSDLIWSVHSNHQYDYPSFSQSVCTFYTYRENFQKMINNFTIFSGIFVLAVDIKYNPQRIDYSNLDNYLNVLANYKKGIVLEFDEDIEIKLGVDLTQSITNFQHIWFLDSLKLISFVVLILIISLFAIVEYLNYNSVSIENIIRIFSDQGISLELMYKFMFLENTLIILVSLISGIFLGGIIGYLSQNILHYNATFVTFLRGYIQPFFLVLIIGIFLTLFIVNIFQSIQLIQNLKDNIEEELDFTKEESFFSRILSLQEIFLLVSGAITIIGGLAIKLGLIRGESINQEVLVIISKNFFIIGILFIFLFMLSIFVRIYLKVWQKMGEKFWKRKKTFLTFTLKNLSKSIKNYNRYSIVILFIGLMIIPGIFFKSSFNNHLEENALLACGCSDLVIENWKNNETLENHLKQMSEIESLTSVYFTKFEAISDERMFTVSVLAINPVSFSSTIDLSSLTSIEYKIEDILELSKNLTYLMNTQFARKQGFNTNKIFQVNDYWQTSEDYSLEYINSFNKFPLFPQDKPNWQEFDFSKENYFHIVISKSTYSKILEKSFDINNLISEYYLLIKKSPNIDSEEISDTLSQEYNLDAKTPLDFQQNMIDDTHQFALNIVRFLLIFSLIVLFFYSFTTSRNLFNQRKKNIESDYHLGANKNQLLKGFVLEIFLISILLVMFSNIIGIFSLYASSIIIDINQEYQIFQPRISIGLIFLSITLYLITVIIGLFLGLSPKIFSYQPKKEE